MGKTALIIVLGMSISLAFVKDVILQRPIEMAENVADYHNAITAKNIARSAANNYLLKLNEDKTLRGTFFESNKYIDNGVDTVFISATGSGGADTISLRVFAHYFNSMSGIEIKLLSSSFTIPPITSAIAYSGDNPDLDINGSLNIDGRNHDLFGNLSSSCVDLPGVAVSNIIDSTDVVDNQLKKKKDDDKVKGLDGAPSVHVRETADPSTYKDIIAANADFTLTSGTYSSHLYYGSQTSPAIVYASGDIHLSGKLYGYGILLVEGTLQLTGQMDWYGLVGLVGTDTQLYSSTGTSRIIGGVVIGGDNKSAKLHGTTDVLYSCDAINNITMNASGLKVFNILSWYE